MPRSILDAERIRAAELDAQILHLECSGSLSTLRTQKALIQGRLDSYKYPVLTLPNEIVSEIFVHFLPAYPECPPLTGILSPTNLTHVCRKWREVAQANPVLWRAARLRFSALPGQTHALDLMYLAMSGCCPLSIDTEEPSDIFDGSVEEWQTNILTLLVPHRARWEYLKLNWLSLPRHRLLEFGHPMPMLRHIFLPFDTEERADPLIFGEAPLLRSVILDGSVLNTFILPWAQLTSVTLHFVYFYECALVFRQTANLTYCSVYLMSSDPDDLEPDVTLSRLESLILDPRSQHIPGFLEIFVAPALHYFEISEKTLGFNPIQSLTSFISKSGCKLQEAYMTGNISVTAEAYRRAFPSVEFSFDGEGIDVVMDSEASSSDPESGSDGE